MKLSTEVIEGREGGGVSHFAKQKALASFTSSPGFNECSISPHLMIPSKNLRGRKEAFSLPLLSSVSLTRVIRCCIKVKNKHATSGELRIETLALRA